jgi:hypothetical protein
LADFDRYVEETASPRRTTRRRSLSGSPRSRAGAEVREGRAGGPADGVVIEGDDLDERTGGERPTL